MARNPDLNSLERRGRLELSKYWPDGTRFRRTFPNLTAARQMRARIEAAIADGTWRELKEKLALPPKTPPPSTSKELTLREYAAIYLAEMRRRNRRPDFHEIQIRNIVPILGDVLKDIRRADAVRYRALRSDGRVAATLNRGVAVLGGMISQAIEDELIPGPNPLFGFEDYKEIERELQIPTMGGRTRDGDGALEHRSCQWGFMRDSWARRRFGPRSVTTEVVLDRRLDRYRDRAGGDLEDEARVAHSHVGFL